MARRNPDEEMFLNRPANDGDSPTVEPLRIFKPQSPRPASAASHERYKYPAPVASRPTFPLPPGASSSAAPLPYPDDDDVRPSQPLKSPRPPYPTEERLSFGGSKPYSPASSVSSGRLNDTTPRLDTSPIEKRGPGLAERRGTAPKLALSPTSPTGDDGGLFAKPLANHQQQQPAAGPAAGSAANFHDYRNKSYYPPPKPSSVASSSSSNSQGRSSSANSHGRPQEPDNSHLKMPAESNVNRFASTASNSTTRANRGSPPPPETPIVEPGHIPGGDIEARYAAAGISGTATLNSLQSPAAAQRLAQYSQQRPIAQPGPGPGPARPWTPTESPDQQPHGPPTVYQGANPVPNAVPSSSASQPRPSSSSTSSSNPALQESVLEQDFRRMQMSDPPPAYSSITPSGGSGYPAEKQRPAPATQAGASTSTPVPAPQAAAAVASAATAAAAAAVPVVSPPKKQADPIAAGLASPALQHPGHPAFANDPRPESVVNGAASSSSSQPVQTPSPFQGQGPSSPPPLPEGWIAHLDQNSGQYYYIHLATQATQWEFPKGPNPLHHDTAPLSPTASTYGNPLASPMFGKQSAMASPMFPPQTPGYAESIMSVAASAAPTAGFTGPPPSAGVDMYKVQPTNGVYFGPYLRYVNMDIERGLWLGSILIVTDAPQPPTIHIHKSVDLSPNPRQLVPHSIYTHQRWQFHKYDINLQMEEGATERWTYAVTSHMGCTRYEFVVAGRHETSWRFIAHSGNDFAASTNQNERSKLGGVGFMWKDVLQKNIDCGGFHAQLGLGDQIYGDRLWKEVPVLKQWLAMQGKENRRNANWTARHEEDVAHAYFHFYTSHFDQPFLREAWAQIPHVCQIDDHDM